MRSIGHEDHQGRPMMMRHFLGLAVLAAVGMFTPYSTGMAADEDGEHACQKEITIIEHGICVSEKMACEPSAAYHLSNGVNLMWLSHVDWSEVHKQFELANERNAAAKPLVAHLYLIKAQSILATAMDNYDEDMRQQGFDLVKRAQKLVPGIDDKWVLGDIMRNRMGLDGGYNFHDPFIRSPC